VLLIAAGTATLLSVIFNFPFEVQHVIPIYHEGTDEPSNLALACRSCNTHKASHLTGFDDVTQEDTVLFNPRLDRWDDHFRIDKETGAILAETSIGRATASRLNINRETQLAARLQWMRLGLFP
jgi:HNH endonuclease